jgi:hypothetical protein
MRWFDEVILWFDIDGEPRPKGDVRADIRPNFSINTFDQLFRDLNDSAERRDGISLIRRLNAHSGWDDTPYTMKSKRANFSVNRVADLERKPLIKDSIAFVEGLARKIQMGRQDAPAWLWTFT